MDDADRSQMYETPRFSQSFRIKKSKKMAQSIDFKGNFKFNKLIDFRNTARK